VLDPSAEIGDRSKERKQATETIRPDGYKKLVTRDLSSEANGMQS